MLLQRCQTAGWVEPDRFGTRTEQWQKLWEQRFRELRSFRKRFGHCQVVTGWIENPNLARWVLRQRENYRHGLIPADRIHLLESLGFTWESEYRHHANLWDHRYEELITFRKRFGHTRVPSHWKENPPLASWEYQQRKLQRLGRLPADRKARLNALGFEWMS